MIVAAAVGVVAFAVQGGEYSTLDLLRQRVRAARMRAELDSLQRAVDSLRAYDRRLRTDASLQERIAREEFGLVRGERELLYRFAEPAPADSAAADSARRGSRP